MHESPIMVIHHPAKPFTSSTPKMLGFQAIRIARKISSKGKCDGAPDMEANGHETSDIFWHFGGVCKTLSVTWSRKCKQVQVIPQIHTQIKIAPKTVISEEVNVLPHPICCEFLVLLRMLRASWCTGAAHEFWFFLSARKEITHGFNIFSDHSPSKYLSILCLGHAGNLNTTQVLLDQTERPTKGRLFTWELDQMSKNHRRWQVLRSLSN